MEREDVERLVRVETKLEAMSEDVAELKGICTKLAARPDMLGWLVQHRKAVLTTVAALAGIAGGSAWWASLVEALGK